MKAAKIKMKFWKRPVEKKEKVEKVENKSLDELASDYSSKFVPKLDPEVGMDVNFDKSVNKAVTAMFSYIEGFQIAKSMIIEFLNQKSLGYNDAYFFKMRDLEALGEPEKISDETMTEKDRVAKWDWSEKDE